MKNNGSINFDNLLEVIGTVWYRNDNNQRGKINIKKENDQYLLFVEAEEKSDPWYRLRLKGSKDFIINKLQERLS